MSAQTIPQTENNAQGRQGRIVAALALSLIILLGAFLRFYQLGAYSIGNIYYAATVKSMLTSWHNLFFAAFEPGGSVSVDKPPLGFWVQASSAYFLSVNGFALALPNALAGMLSIPLLYSLVKKQFGVLAALVAALVLAVLPVAVSTERNNTIDGLLVFVLLLAAWAVWRSVASGKLRYLLLGAFIVGLGFNIKMLQAYMILPAVYALYLFGAKHAWWMRIVHLVVASLLLLVVSLSWAAFVDLTPTDSRPYVGSSTDNTEMELIVAHNGLSRLFAQARRGPTNAREDRPAAATVAQPNLPVRPPLQSYGG
jgi:4-amino-4-deoxy-L-arabinose transferase-like glycosyltransferase